MAFSQWTEIQLFFESWSHNDSTSSIQYHWITFFLSIFLSPLLLHWESWFSTSIYSFICSIYNIIQYSSRITPMSLLTRLLSLRFLCIFFFLEYIPFRACKVLCSKVCELILFSMWPAIWHKVRFTCFCLYSILGFVFLHPFRFYVLDMLNILRLKKNQTI